IKQRVTFSIEIFDCFILSLMLHLSLLRLFVSALSHIRSSHRDGHLESLVSPCWSRRCFSGPVARKWSTCLRLDLVICAKHLAKKVSSPWPASRWFTFSS